MSSLVQGAARGAFAGSVTECVPEVEAEAVAGAATARLRAWLVPTRDTGTVVHAGADVVYAEVDGRCVGLLAHSAVQVPCGIRTTLPSLGARPGDVVRLPGGGRLTVAGYDVQVRRTVPVRPVCFGDRTRAGSTLRRLLLPRLGPVLAELPSEALHALGAGDPAAVPQLLGRGSGLTPLGDDVLCGWLASTPGLSRIADEVVRLAPQRTTVLSTTLLDCACHGETVPEFGRLAEALDNDDTAECASAVEGLVAVGHTSGAGLALGCLLALGGRP